MLFRPNKVNHPLCKSISNFDNVVRILSSSCKHSFSLFPQEFKFSLRSNTLASNHCAESKTFTVAQTWFRFPRPHLNNIFTFTELFLGVIFEVISPHESECSVR